MKKCSSNTSCNTNNNNFENKFQEDIWIKISKRHEKIKKEVEYYQDLLSTEECVEEALKKIK